MNSVNGDTRCEAFRELASARVDERLDGGEMLRLEEHLRACAGCREFENGVRRYRGLLQAAEAVRPLRRPPAGFAAAVIARIDGPPQARAVPFPGGQAERRLSRVSWAGMVAAAAAAALFFAWSWQRLLPLDALERRIAATPVASAVDVAAVDDGSIDIWMREHVQLSRGGTLLGSAEESEFGRVQSVAIPER